MTTLELQSTLNLCDFTDGFYSMCMALCQHVCLYAMCMPDACRLGGSFGSAGTGVADGCEPPCG